MGFIGLLGMYKAYWADMFFCNEHKASGVMGFIGFIGFIMLNSFIAISIGLQTL